LGAKILIPIIALFITFSTYVAKYGINLPKSKKAEVKKEKVVQKPVKKRKIVKPVVKASKKKSKSLAQKGSTKLLREFIDTELLSIYQFKGMCNAHIKSIRKLGYYIEDKNQRKYEKYERTVEEEAESIIVLKKITEKELKAWLVPHKLFNPFSRERIFRQYLSKINSYSRGEKIKFFKMLEKVKDCDFYHRWNLYKAVTISLQKFDYSRKEKVNILKHAKLFYLKGIRSPYSSLAFQVYLYGLIELVKMSTDQYELVTELKLVRKRVETKTKTRPRDIARIRKIDQASERELKRMDNWIKEDLSIYSKARREVLGLAKEYRF